MTRYAWLALAGLAMFGFFLLQRLPASLITTQLPPAWQLSGVQGTLWRGRAGEVRLRGVSLGRVQWYWQPRTLLAFALGYRLRFDGQAVNGTGGLEVGPGGHWELDDLDITLSLDDLRPLLPPRQTQVSGQLQMVSKRLELQQGWPVRGGFELRWHEAALFGSLPMRLGELTAGANTVSADTLALEFVDGGGPLALTGTGSLRRDGDYQLDLQLRARDSADDNLRTSLSLLGTPDATGRIHFQRHGRLPRMVGLR